MLSSPSHRLTHHHSDILHSYACAIHGTCVCLGLGSMAPRRCKSLSFRSEVSKKNVDGILLGALLYLGAMRHAFSTRRAICEVAQLRAARATWAGSTSSGTEPLLRPRSENPEIRIESMSCVVIKCQKSILVPVEPIIHGGARADIAGPLTLTGRCWHPSGATGDVLIP